MASGDFPIPKFAFSVNFSPGGTISFQEVSGLDVENEFVEYRNGSDPFFTPERRAGMRKAGTLVLKKGIMMDDTDIMDLYNKLVDKTDYYAEVGTTLDVTVDLLDEAGGIVRTWIIYSAVPTKLSTDSLNSTENAIAVETLELAHSGIDIM